jgi:multidrug efflux pump subunit AcrA (membrane-fusion protein)
MTSASQGFLAILLFLSLPALAVDEKPKLATVFATPIKSTELFDDLIYPARVVSKINTAILAEADGVVTRIFAPLGQKVGRAQRLMTVRHTDPVYQFAPILVTTPVSGVVSAVEVSEGTQVTKGQKLASITDPGEVRIQVEIPAQDLALLSKGAPGVFRPTGQDRSTPVRIRGLSPFVDPGTGTATGEIEIVSSQGAPQVPLPPGLLGQVSFRANTHQGISIPDHAVLYKGEQTFVRLVEGGKAKQVAVRLGRKQRGYVEVVEGLRPDMQLVERSSRYLADGEAVTVETQEKAAEGAKKGAKK